MDPSHTEGFSMRLVTVPSNRGEYRPMNTSALRVKGLTGYNYWGKATEQNVAASLKELLG